MFIVKYYLVGSLASMMLAFVVPHWYFTIAFSWIGISLLIVSIAYLLDKPSVFRKKQDGSIPVYIKCFLLPFLLGVQLYNSWARRTDSVPAIQEIAPNLYLGCRLFPSDIEHLKSLNIHAILDATSEFSGLDWSAQDGDLDYLNVPILDHSAPRNQDLMRAIYWISNQINNNRGVVVHCALGRGRSVLIVAAYLLASREFDSLDDALKRINSIRGTARLNQKQYRTLEQMHQSNTFSNDRSVLLIVNPVSGAGNWEKYKKAIKQNLSVQYQIEFRYTSVETSAREIAKQSIGKQYALVVACGGDGTVNEVASVLVNTNVLMGIIPLGTTNALAHVLMGSRSKLAPIDIACEDIINAQSIAMDTAICNDDIVLLLAGIGFEQKMISSADRQEKNENGELAYIAGLGAAIKENETKEYEISIDDLPPKKVQASSIVVANAAPFTTVLAQGGGQPDPMDGFLDLTILNTKEGVTLPLIALIKNGLSNASTADDEISVDGLDARQLKTLTIKHEDLIQYVIDGEVRISETLNIKINPESLRVVHGQRINHLNNTVNKA